MRLGILITRHPNPEQPSALADMLRRIEDLGFDSVWTPHAVGRGSLVPDPMVLLTIASSVTSRVEIGTAVIQLPLLNPTVLLHQLLSISQTAGDRLTIGVGVGSTETDFLAHGKNFKTRFKNFESMVAQLREGLTTGNCGETNFGADPVQLARSIPLLLGSWGAGVVRAARDFDGWIASAAYRTEEEVCASLQQYRDTGGNRALVSTIRGVPDLAVLGKRLETFEKAGFDDAVVAVYPGSATPQQIRNLVS